ncbi:hypothetical protein M413DRAFT_26582 [Hebeloma cylindrosporum]|uniref:Uncharacterized protein n=1 Tax=Hebeloma cylindrosporum TaxID=76867 RepID=A0A0C2XY07_HEBCY|nr:hypothetical protein M413DRAFT_26582 [Hebeloma cylindrosporum h7]
MPKPTQPTTTTPPPKERLMAWARELYTVVQDEKKYAQQHDTLFQQFDLLHDATRHLPPPTFIHHVAPIYNHTASQGYQPPIHLQSLRDAVFRWCRNEPVDPWKAPPDQQSRSPSPVLPPAPTKSTLPHKPLPPTKLGPSKTAEATAGSSKPPPMARGSTKPSSKSAPTAPTDKPKKKCRPKKSAPVVDEQDDSNHEADEENEEDAPTNNGAKQPVSTAGMSLHLTKCKRCEGLGHPCNVNPQARGPNTACYQCYDWKAACSHTGGRGASKAAPEAGPSGSVGIPLEVVRARSTAKAEGVEEGLLGSPTKKVRSRKKATTVPAGESGEYRPPFVPTDIMERLKAYESAHQADQEKITELSQQIARMETENRTTQQWCSAGLLSLWENTSGRDLGVMTVLRDMHAVLVEESLRQHRLEQTTQTLQALLEIPPLPNLQQPAHLPHFPNANALAPATTTTTTTITTTDSTSPANAAIANEPVTTTPPGQSAAPILEEPTSPLTDHSGSEEEQEVPLANGKKRGGSALPDAGKHKHPKRG